MAPGLALLAISGTATALSLPGFLPVLRRLAVDLPSARSSHVVPTPRGGGLAVVLGVSAALIVAAEMSYASISPLIVVALAGLASVGFADDLRNLGIGPRLLVQVVCAVVAVSAVARDDGVSATVVLLACFVFVGNVNAFNFMDGVNGISGLVAFVSGVWFLLLGASDGVPEVVLLGSAAAGAGIGFLPWNLKGAVFLGDVGSYFLGGLFGICCVWLAATGTNPLLAAAPLVPYIADTTWTLVRRSLGGEGVGAPHRDHAYQRLARSGLGHTGAALALAMLVTLCCVVAQAFSGSWVVVVPIWIAICALYLASPNAIAPMVGRRG